MYAPDGKEMKEGCLLVNNQLIFENMCDRIKKLNLDQCSNFVEIYEIIV